MVDVVIPYTNQEAVSRDEPVELDDGRIVLIDPEGLVALALDELGAKLVDVEPEENTRPDLTEAA